MSGSSPHIRVRLRLSERQGQELAAKLTPATPGQPADLAGALTMLQDHYKLTLPARIAGRLVRRGLQPDTAKAAATADKIIAGVSAALSAMLKERPHLIAAAVRDPADGITITVTFPGLTRESLDAPLPAGTVEVSPGWEVR
jgi:phenylpyruvate tautomerase PptA (4-oxalocrotonate tautomerase family)